MSSHRKKGQTRRRERYPVEQNPDSSDNESVDSKEDLASNSNSEYYEISHWETDAVTEAKGHSKEGPAAEDIPPIRKLFVGNLSDRTSQSDLKNFFRHFGRIMDIRISRDGRTGTRRNYGFVTYKDPADAAKVLSLTPDELCLHWRELRVAPADAWHQPRETADGRVVWHRKLYEEPSVSPELLEARKRSEKEVDESQCRIHILNDDCLMYVFSFLSKKERVKVERVCKRWQGLSRSTWLYQQHLDFTAMFNSREGTYPTANILRGLLTRCGPNLPSLDLSHRPHEFNSRVLSIVAKHAPRLRCLNLSGLPLVSHSLRRLSEVSQNLQTLNLEGCSGLLDRDLLVLFLRCPLLESLVLSHNHQLTGKCLNGLASGRLSRLVLDDCNNLRSRFLVGGLRSLRQLTHLSLNSCINLTSSDVTNILQSLPQLEYLSIGKYFPLLSTKALCSLEYLKNLVALNVQHNPAVNDQIIEVIAKNCVKLERLNVAGCSVQNTAPGEQDSLTNAGFRWLARLPHLSELTMSYLAVVTDEALDAVADRGKLKRLECRGCPTFTDAGCMRVVALCGELELFDFCGCDHVSNATVETALESVKERTNGAKLRLVAGGTKVTGSVEEHPLLEVDLADLCLAHLRPDFVDDVYFQSSDNEDDEDEDDDDNEDYYIGGLMEFAWDSVSAYSSDGIEWDRYSYYSYDGYDCFDGEEFQ